MTLSRLLLRSVRRFSSSTNPYTFNSQFSASTTQFNNNHQTHPQYPNPNNQQGNPHYNQQYSEVPFGKPVSHNAPQFPSDNQFNSQYSNTGPPNQTFSSQSYSNTTNQIPNHSYQSSSAAPIAQNYGSSDANSSSAGQTQSFNFPSSISSTQTGPQRSYGFSSAEEAAAERRRRKRRLRIEPPLYALRQNAQTPRADANNPNKPKLPDSTSALVGNRLNLHNRVQSLIRSGDLDAASYVVRQSVFQYVRPTVFTCNAIIAAMYRAKRYNDAKVLFQYFFRQNEIIPNIVSYNNLIVSHCESNEIEDALKAYNCILEEAPYSPSAVTYRHLTKGLIDADSMDEAVSLLREMLNKGHGADSLVFNNVILGYLNLGKLDKANELFDELKERCTVYDGAVNATFMDWFFNQGKPKEAMESYKDLMSKNYRMVPATRNVLLETLLKHGKKKEAWDLFHDMLDDHTPPTFQAVNSDTVNMMVNECFKEGKIEEAVDVFKRPGKGLKSKPFQMDVAGFNNMMARMSELEMMDEAEVYYKQLCDKSLSPDVNTYKTLIDAYIKVDRVDRMIEKYTKMVDANLRVIPPYANKWFKFMIEKGKATDCVPILSKMVDREPMPDVTTYDVVLRGLVAEGNYDAVVEVVKEMMSIGVGTTVSLKEFILDVFGQQGRSKEIEDVFRNTFPKPRPPPRTPTGPLSFLRTTENVDQGVKNPSTPWQQTTFPSPKTDPNQFVEQSRQPERTNYSPSSYGNQYAEQSHQPERTNYPPTSYGNQFAGQTHQHERATNPQTSYGNQFAGQTHQHERATNPQTSYGNQFGGQTHQHERTTNPQTSYGNQFTGQAHQHERTTNPQTSYGNQFAGLTRQPERTNYSQSSSYGNQFAGQTHQHERTTNPPTSYGNQYAEQTRQPERTNYPPSSFGNHLAEYRSQPQMSSSQVAQQSYANQVSNHSIQSSEHEAELPRVAGQSVA